MISRDNFALVAVSLLVAGLLFLFGPLVREQDSMCSETEKPVAAAEQPAAMDFK